MAVLHDLPLEITEMIVSHLDVDPPSKRNFFHEPRPNLFKPMNPPLKNLSLTCRSFRRLTFDSLFLHLKISNHLKIDALLIFLKTHLAAKSQLFRSVLVHDMNCIEAATVPTLLTTIYKIMDMIKPTDLILALNPDVLAKVLVGQSYSRDSWAFQIPFQMIRLRRSPFEEPAWHSWHSTCRRKISAILRLYPWAEISYNEGSSVPAYSTYEYYRLRITSWFERWQLSAFEMGLGMRTVLSPTQNHLASHLICFDFIAVFPWMSRMTAFLDQLPKLRVLRTQLSPCTWHEADGEGCSVGAAASLGTGRAEHRDLWMEFENTYTALAEWMYRRAVTSRLVRLEVLDYGNEGLGSTLDACFTDDFMGRAWTRCAAGVWEKKEELRIRE